MSDFCQCHTVSPRYGPGTLTEYVGVPTLYKLCVDCGLPVASTGRPAPEIIVGEPPTVQKARYAMRRTAE
jgi:hypothetical protein